MVLSVYRDLFLGCIHKECSQIQAEVTCSWAKGKLAETGRMSQNVEEAACRKKGPVVLPVYLSHMLRTVAMQYGVHYYHAAQVG